MTHLNYINGYFGTVKTARQQKIINKTKYKVAPSLEKEYEQLRPDLDRLNIKHPERFSPGLLREIIANRDHPERVDNRPIALVLYPTEDKDDSFFYNNIINLYIHKYKIFYYEISTDNDFCKTIKEVGKNKRIHILVIGGHGSQNLASVNLGAKNNQKINNYEQLYLDYSDLEQFKNEHLAEYLENGSHIIIESCYAGYQKAYHKNMANFFHKIFTKSNIYSPTLTSHIEKYYFAQDHTFLSLDYLVNLNKIQRKNNKTNIVEKYEIRYEQGEISKNFPPPRTGKLFASDK